MAVVRLRDVCRAVLLTTLLASAFASYNIDEDVHLDPVGLLRKYGYPAEAHEVTTADGYVLALHRVPSSPVAPPREGERRPVVFLLHGFLCSSADWVVMGPGAGLAYILADAGYDVWMGNVRGNTYSRRHIKYSPDGLSKSKFWDFEWHEMGIYDLPASIDHVLEVTGQEKMFFIAHSMGNNVFFVMNSRKPEYNSKFHAMFAMAPGAYLSHLRNPIIRYSAPFHKLIEFIAKLFGYYELLPNNKMMKWFANTFCRNNVPFQAICEQLFFNNGGYSSEEVNSTMLPVIVSHMPAGTSMKTLSHFWQMILSDTFQEYDYYLANYAHYGSLSPPKYNLSKVTVPVSIHFSVGDELIGYKDALRTYKELLNRIGLFKVPEDSFGHTSFLWGKHAKQKVYDLILKLMKRY